MAWYLLAWQRATDFSGRSRRTEYWMFQLFNIAYRNGDRGGGLWHWPVA